MIITADTIVGQAAVTIDTTSAGANAGAISLTGKNILTNQATLLATAPAGRPLASRADSA